MRRVFALLGFASVLSAAVASFVVLPQGASRAAATASEATFLIPASEGYGVADCLSGVNLECGQVIAAAWCEAQGYARAKSFGPAAAEDHTASVKPASARPDDGRPIAITCED
jgi:hypothetical protein